MTLWAIVPAKPLRTGKSRLAGVLTEEQRAELNRRLFLHTIQTLRRLYPQIEQVLVTSRDPAILALARRNGARTVQEESTSGLNIALARATFIAQERYTRGVLILPVDLPMLQPEDIQEILKQGEEAPVVVIVPDRHENGTNALLISPPGLIAYDFGPGSFRRHCERARAAGATLKVLHLPRLALDLDDAEDFALLQEHLAAILQETDPP